MRLKISSFICMLLLIINIIPASASEKGIIVSIDNIDEIVIDNNIELKIAKNSLESKIQYYKDLDKKINKLQREITDLKADDKSEKITDSDKPDDKSEKINQKEAELDTLEKEYDKKKDDLKIARITFQNKVRDLVTTAQQKYIDYLYNKSLKDIKEEEVNYNKDKNNINKAKYDMGYISRNEYLTNTVDFIDIENTYNKSITDEEMSLKELKSALGIDDENITVNENLDFDISKIANIDFEEDFNQVINNNSNIKIKKIELDQVEDNDDSDDYEIDNAELELTKGKSDLRLTFQDNYNNLMNSYNSIKNSMNKLTDKENAFNIKKVKLNHGYISNKECEEAYIQLINQKSEYIKEKNTLYVNYLKYMQMKDGYLI